MCASWLISLSIDLISVWVKKFFFQISSNLLSDFFLQITKAIKKPKTSLESYFNSLPTGSQEALQWLEISRYLVIGRGFSLHCQWISRYLWNGRGFPLYCVFPKQHFHSQHALSKIQLQNAAVTWNKRNIFAGIECCGRQTHKLFWDFPWDGRTVLLEEKEWEP